jgi:hypothetical protein
MWCDMTADGGGYILIGRMNTSVTWSLPAIDIPVEPFGEPHIGQALFVMHQSWTLGYRWLRKMILNPQ